MSEKDVAGALGLAQKAGKISSGDLGVKDALSGGKAKLLVIAVDAAPNTVKELNFLAKKYLCLLSHVCSALSWGSASAKRPVQPSLYWTKGLPD